VGLSRALGDEGGQGGHPIGARQTVVQIVGDVDAELGRCLRESAEDVPGREARVRSPHRNTVWSWAALSSWRLPR